MLEIKTACIGYDDKTIFSDVDFLLKEGEIGCITGPSGSGKTSFLRAVMGFIPLSKGEIYFNGLPLSPRTAETVRREMAYVPQELSLPTEWVMDMINIPFLFKTNKVHPLIKEDLLENLQLLGLEENILKKRTNEISGGQRQRIMLAVSTLLGKKLILTDEPTSALDINSCEKVLALFKKSCKKGVMILAVTHDLAFASACDRILHINNNNEND